MGKSAHLANMKRWVQIPLKMGDTTPLARELRDRQISGVFQVPSSEVRVRERPCLRGTGWEAA